MQLQSSVVLFLLAALALANLPFYAPAGGLARLWGNTRRSPRVDALGWLVAYAAWMGLSFPLAAAASHAAPPAWELWPVSVALFALLAFPGIAWRYLAVHQAGRDSS
jgi:hypothetical protein